MTNQDFAATIPLTADAATALSSTIPTNLAILRDDFRGPTAPPSPIAGQPWNDTTTGARRLWDGSAWQPVGPIHGRAAALGQAVVTATGTGTAMLCCAEHSVVVTGLALFHKTATTSDGSNLWTWQLRNLVTNSTLFSSAPTTNGNDLAINTRKLLTPNQNLTLAAGAALQFEYTETGTATNLADLLVVAYGYAITP